jgi:hypothetical protein
MKNVSDVASSGMRNVTSFVKTGIAFQAILCLCLKILTDCNVVITDGRDL